ncbi:MAG TPA: four helix bundle protein [Verrucomicrobiae bacterium]
MGAVKKNVLQEKSYAFALKAVAEYRELSNSKEFVLSKQMLRAATSIGANVEEALGGQSRADFVSKMSIARKEARETSYWLRLLRDSGLMDHRRADILLKDSTELIILLTSIVKTTKGIV